MMKENTLHIATNGIRINGVELHCVTDFNISQGSCQPIPKVSLAFEIPRANLFVGGELEEVPCKSGFSQALEWLKDGKRVKRTGWNGKGMWIRLVQPETPENLPYIEMKTADGRLIPWTASQTDLLADDWKVIDGVLHKMLAEQ